MATSLLTGANREPLEMRRMWIVKERMNIFMRLTSSKLPQMYGRMNLFPFFSSKDTDIVTNSLFNPHSIFSRLLEKPPYPPSYSLISDISANHEHPDLAIQHPYGDQGGLWASVSH